MTQALGPKLGGTGSKSVPAENQLLVGDGDGGFVLKNYIAVSDTPPASPVIDDLWVDKNA